MSDSAPFVDSSGVWHRRFGRILDQYSESIKWASCQVIGWERQRGTDCLGMLRSQNKVQGTARSKLSLVIGFLAGEWFGPHQRVDFEHLFSSLSSTGPVCFGAWPTRRQFLRLWLQAQWLAGKSNSMLVLATSFHHGQLQWFFPILRLNSSAPQNQDPDPFCPILAPHAENTAS